MDGSRAKCNVSVKEVKTQSQIPLIIHEITVRWQWTSKSNYTSQLSNAEVILFVYSQYLLGIKRLCNKVGEELVLITRKTLCNTVVTTCSCLLINSAFLSAGALFYSQIHLSPFLCQILSFLGYVNPLSANWINKSASQKPKALAGLWSQSLIVWRQQVLQLLGSLYILCLNIHPCFETCEMEAISFPEY